jgi:hypothetical protein
MECSHGLRWVWTLFVLGTACSGKAGEPLPGDPLPAGGSGVSAGTTGANAGTTGANAGTTGGGAGTEARGEVRPLGHRSVSTPCENDNPVDDFCITDADCKTGGPCSCSVRQGSGSWNVCLDGDCRTDADCESGYHCAASAPCGGGDVTGYYCQTAADSCSAHTDCDVEFSGPGQCTYYPDRGRWDCAVSPSCPAGDLLPPRD